MFDEYSQALFRDFPEFDGLSRENATRTLSAAYLSVIRHRVNGPDGGTGQSGAEQPYLRRLANTLFFHVVLREDHVQADRQAAAFVAAESLALMADYLVVDQESHGKAAVYGRSAERFARVESALLYLFSQYDACAGAVLRVSSGLGVEPTLADQAADWALTRLEQLCRRELHPTLDANFPFITRDGPTLSAEDLEQDTVARLYGELGRVSIGFTGWLGGTNGDLSLETTTRRLEDVLDALAPDPATPDAGPIGYEFGRIFHLCTLLRLCWPTLRDRALLHVVPSPSRGDRNRGRYRKYLQARAVGDIHMSGRPVLWPSALAYVKECILGDTKHAVVSMPTGSGKSFIAELAVSQAVSDGWALYLAPTNALTEQVRMDLRGGLRELRTEVFAYVGDQEYSILEADRVVEMPVNSVAVMTPEKCSLALRLSPEAFETCRLVVFDECHLLGDSGSTRGPLAELVLTQLMLRAVDCRFLLMSAIVQNPNELARWIEDATGGNGRALTVRWRPTRTLRTVLGIDYESFQESRVRAEAELRELPDRRRNQAFGANCAVAASLQGAWQSQDEADYTIARLECNAKLSVHRTRVGNGWHYEVDPGSWVNATATSLATRLVQQGIQTLVFTPASKHYPFSNGGKVVLTRDVLASLPDAPSLVRACATLAEYELGCRSQVFELLARGVAVHTSLMLETEKIGSETMFRRRGAPVMFATGTLAQGLNLPAVAVVIAGSRIGDPRGEDQLLVRRRRFSQLLNAAGRAGRAGFANQGLVVAIPDRPVSFRDFDDVLRVRQQVDYLQQSDDSVSVESGLDAFLDSVCENTLRSDQANDLELQIVSLLAGGDKGQLNPQPLLQRTFGAYLRRKAGKPDIEESNANHLMELGRQFIGETGAPPWLTVAAQRAGLNFFLTLAIVRAWERVREERDAEFVDWSVADWTEELLRVVVYIPPALLAQHLTPQRLGAVSAEFAVLRKKHADLFLVRTVDWDPPAQWLSAWGTVSGPLKAWMQGRSLREIASIMTGVAAEELPVERTQGKPIPKVLSVVGESWSALALIAGGLLAVAEQVLEGRVPLQLSCLPMCVKYGCDSPGTLAWFRFGVRLRRPSRLLASRLPPPQLQNDEELKSWVRSARGDWLASGSTEYGEDPDAKILAAVRSFITSY